jgi:hypothetical protein
MFQYGALERESSQSATLQRREQNRNNRTWPISAVMISVMTATVLFLLWDGNSVIISDVQPVDSIQSKMVPKRRNAKLSTNLTAKMTSTLVSSDVPSYGDYVDDMPDRPKYFPSFPTLVRGSVKIDCSDTVAWGR